MKRAVKRTLPLELGKTWSYLLRDCFYNRLIEGGMFDVHGEYLMGHGLGVRGHCCDEHREELREQYQRCHFNREVPSTRVEALEKEVERLRSFIKDIEGILKANVKIVNGKPFIDIPWSKVDGKTVTFQSLLHPSKDKKEKTSNPNNSFNSNNCCKRKIVEERDLEKYPECEIETALPSGKISIRTKVCI